MNRRQFLVLLAVLAVLGGAGLALVWQDIAAYRASGAKIGAKLLPGLKIADVAEIRLQDSRQQVTLARGEKNWVVRERGGYPASFSDISDLMIKLVELKVTQSEQVGATLLPRLDLAEPGTAAEAAKPSRSDGAGTLIEFKDATGKALARIILGKKVLKKDPMNPLPIAKDGVPAGRYVLLANAKDTVVVVSDPLNVADASPGKWLNKDFFKAERIRTLAAGPAGGAPQWKIERDVEWGQWKLVGGGQLDPSAAVVAANKLAGLSFADVAVEPKPETTGKPLVVVAETFDKLVYTLRFAKAAKADDYLLTLSVTGEPPKSRAQEKGEKKEEKERRDKDFAETRKRLEERIAAEKALAKWTYVIPRREIEPLLKGRGEMIARRAEDARR